jgi:predicted dehydrogenase
MNALSDYFVITYLCDVSKDALDHCSKKVAGRTPKTTTIADELCASQDVDAVVVCNATAFHVAHAVLALANHKDVFVEKPLALCYRDIDALVSAEAKSEGKVFVGYMRRYAPVLAQAMKEIGDQTKIQYARVRDIIGPNADFVSQSGAFPKRFSDFAPEDSSLLSAMDQDINQQALEKEFGIPITAATKTMLRALGGLGSHDLSAMREILGMPQKVIGADLRTPMWSALFDYGQFSVLYESGLNSVPVFDAHIEVYTPEKIVRIQYDTPYVKGLPTTMLVRERVDGPNGEASYQERHVRLTYEDSYTIEFKHWHECLVSKKAFKTTIEDARQDVDIFRMLMQDAFK